MKKVICGLMMIAALSACGTLSKDKLGLGKDVPNEALVTPRKPLSLPPEYDLRPVNETMVNSAEENI